LHNLVLGQDWIKLGWIDKSGRSLSWRYWQQKGHRSPIAYLRNAYGKLSPIYDAWQGC